MIEIKTIQDIPRFSTAINEGAKGKFSLMKEDYILLPFNTTSPVDFHVGDYVDLRGVLDASMGGKLAKVYQIVDMSYPTYRNGGYSYELRLDAYYWQWKTKIFKYTPEVGGQEASWSLTAPLDVQLGVFLRNLKALGYTYDGQDFTFSIDDTVESSAKFMSYDNINLLDAIFEMAKQWNCDCWVTDHVVNFGRCEYSDPVKVELDVEAQDMSRSESKGIYATRIYAFGSTRNIPANYRPVDSSMVVGGIVERRLMLPVDTPYVDAYEGMTDQEAVEAVIVFDDVYPHRVGTISDITSYESEVDNEDGTKTKATFYRFKDSGINFSKEYILEGNELKIRFQSGKLNGMEFGAMFNPLGLTEKNDDGTWNPDAQLWEIVLSEDYGRPLPDTILCPEAGNTYVLSGWNAEKITDLGLVSSAEQELLSEAEKYIAKTRIDDGTYTATLDSIWVYEDQINHSFDIGQRINQVNPSYFKNGRISRVIGFEIKLDLPYDSPEYTIGESSAYSRISDIEGKVESLTFKGQTFTGSGGSNIYVIKTNDSTAASNFNVFSALCTLRMFLRKDAPDVADELITFLKGLLIGKNGSGITTLKDGTSQAVVDRLYVRIKAVFEELQVKKATHVGGEQIITHAGMKCIRVEELARVYRCYFLAEQEGEAIANEFSVGSLAQAKECNIVDGTTLDASNRYYWREVVNVGRDYIDLSKTICDKGSDSPQAGNDIIGLGHRKDIDLQSAIVLSSTGMTSPSIVFYAGIDNFSLEEKDIISFGLDKSTGHAYMKVYGTSYIGARDESTYIKYTPEGGVEIKGRFLSVTGKDVMTMFSIMEGMIKSEISSVRNEINAKDNYLSNASFSDNLTGWQGSSNIRIFSVNGKLLYFNNNFYANKENLANIVSYGSKNVLRLKNSSITQYNSNFSIQPEFDEYIQEDPEGNPILDSSGNPVTLKRARMFYVSFRYMVTLPGILTVYFKNENSLGFEEYNPIYHSEYLQPGEEFKVMEIAGKWNGTGDFFLSFSGDMYMYSLALADNRLADAIEKFTMRFEATDKKIQANLDEIRATGTKLEEYHSEFLLTARQLELKFTQDLSDSETRITQAYKSWVQITSRDLRLEFTADINDAEKRITTAYTGAITTSAQGLEAKFTKGITDMEVGITTAYKGYFKVEADGMTSAFNQKLVDLKDGVTEEYESYFRVQADGLTSAFNKQIDDINGVLTIHSSQFNVTADKISALVTATNNIDNTIKTAGWITTADGNKLWATLNQYNSLNSLVASHSSSLQINADEIRGLVSTTSSLGGRLTTAESSIIQNANSITSKVSNTDFSREIDNAKILAAVATGASLYNDPTFNKGKNGISPYNNAGGSAVTIARKLISGVPNDTGYGLEIITSASGNVTPGWGGFYFGTMAKANRLLVCRFTAKIPVGYTIVFTTNAIGTGDRRKWLTDNVGTDKWQEYAYYLQCGSSGTFSSTFFFYLEGKNRPVTWQLAQANVYELSAQDLASKYSQIKQTVDSISFEVNDTNGKFARLEVAVDTIAGIIGDGAEGDFSQILQRLGSVEITVQKLHFDKDGNLTNISKAGITTDVNGNYLFATKTEFDQQGNQIEQVQSSINQTADKVETIAGRFNADGTLKEGAGWVTTSQGNNLWAAKGTEEDAAAAGQAAIAAATAAADALLKANSAADVAGNTATALVQTNAAISTIAGRFNADGTLKEGAGWVTTVDANTLWVKKDGIISSINQTAESVSISASKINLNGAVRISSLAQDVKDSINSKVSSNALGSLAFKNEIEIAQLGETIIEGGYLNTELINVNTLIAKKLHTDNGNYKVDIDSDGLRISTIAVNSDLVNIGANFVSNTWTAYMELTGNVRTDIPKLNLDASSGVRQYNNGVLMFLLSDSGLFFYDRNGNLTKSYPAR